jgi:hypothetical protein
MALQHRTYPTGLTVWSLPGSDVMSVVWLGPGAGLSLGFNVDQPGGTMARIEHPSASGTFDTRKQAEKAVAAFIAASAE